MYITTIADSYVQINYSLSLSLSHTLESNLNNLSYFLLYRRQHKYAISSVVLSMYNQVSLFHHNRNALRFLWDVNDSVVPHGLLVHPLSCVFCTCASTCVLHEPSISILDIVIHDVSFHLSYTMIVHYL